MNRIPLYARRITQPRPSRLKKLREAHGWSQEKLDVAAGVDVRLIRKIEKYNYYPPTPAIRASLAQALGVGEDDIWPAPAEPAETDA